MYIFITNYLTIPFKYGELVVEYKEKWAMII